MRDEAEHVIDSPRRELHVGETAQVPVVICTTRRPGCQFRTYRPKTCRNIAEAIQKQETVSTRYPYVALSTVWRHPNVWKTQTRVPITWSKAMPERRARDLADPRRNGV